MKILQVIPYYAPAWTIGGTVNVAYEISTQLAKNGHEVTVCTSDILDQFHRIPFEGKSNFIEIDGVKVIYFKNLSLIFYRFTRLLITLGMINFLKKEVPKFDIIHLHQYRTFQNIITIYYARKYNIPCFLHPHGSIGRIVEKQSLKFLFDVFFGKYILDSMDKVFALTRTEAMECHNRGVSDFKIEIVPNGVNIDQLKKIPEKGTFRRKYSVGNDKKIILYLGRIHRSKGLDILVHAVRDLLKEIENVDLLLVGPDDRYKHELEKIINELRISKHIRFFGFLPEQDKYAALIDADTLITPIFYGFPITFVESMACGTPIITTNKGDIIDSINHSTGLVVDYTIDALKGAMEKILKDEKLRDRFGQKGKYLVHQKYNWKSITHTIEGHYQNSLKDK
jgi:glycosyltransferase involved in cell wall biosynthesis